MTERTPPRRDSFKQSRSEGSDIRLTLAPHPDWFHTLWAEHGWCWDQKKMFAASRGTRRLNVFSGDLQLCCSVRSAMSIARRPDCPPRSGYRSGMCPRDGKTSRSPGAEKWRFEPDFYKHSSPNGAAREGKRVIQPLAAATELMVKVSSHGGPSEPGWRGPNRV